MKKRHWSVFFFIFSNYTDKFPFQPWCNHPNTIYNAQLQKTAYVRNSTTAHRCSHGISIMSIFAAKWQIRISLYAHGKIWRYNHGFQKIQILGQGVLCTILQWRIMWCIVMWSIVVRCTMFCYVMYWSCVELDPRPVMLVFLQSLTCYC